MWVQEEGQAAVGRGLLGLTLLSGAVLGLRRLCRGRRISQPSTNHRTVEISFSEVESCCARRLFEHYEWMATFSKLTTSERDRLKRMSVVELVAACQCEVIKDTLVVVAQWTLPLPDDHCLLGPTVKYLDENGVVLSNDNTSRKMKLWRTMHFITPGSLLSGCMQSIVSAESVRKARKEDEHFQLITNAVDMVELRYTRCMLSCLPLLTALHNRTGLGTGAASKALVLGCGAGTIPMLLRAKYPSMEIHVVEVEPVVLDLAADWMGFEKAGVEVHLADAKEFLRTTNHRFDIIFVDAYETSEVPEHIGSDMPGYLAQLRHCLKPTGVVGGNVIFYTLDSKKTDLALWSTVFAAPPFVVPCGANQCIVLAGQLDGGPIPSSITPATLSTHARLVSEEGHYTTPLSGTCSRGA